MALYKYVYYFYYYYYLVKYTVPRGPQSYDFVAGQECVQQSMADIIKTIKEINHKIFQKCWQEMIPASLDGFRRRNGSIVKMLIFIHPHFCSPLCISINITVNNKHLDV